MCFESNTIMQSDKTVFKGCKNQTDVFTLFVIDIFKTAMKSISYLTGIQIGQNFDTTCCFHVAMPLYINWKSKQKSFI